MNIGAAQSQGLLSATKTVSMSARVQVTAARILSADPKAPDEAVVLSVNRRIDFEYTQRVLSDSVENRLDKALEKAGLDTKAESLLQEGLDLTPEATAERITQFATSFFGAYQANNPDVEAEQQVNDFTELIKGAVEEGFADAKEILSGIGRIPAQVGEDMDRTLELTMAGIDRFADEQLQVLSMPNPDDVEDGLLAV